MKIPVSLSRRVSSFTEKVRSEPVAATNIAGAAIAVVVGLGVPVSEDLKVGLIGLIGGVATIYGRSQVVPNQTLVKSEVLPSPAGEPVEIVPASGESIIIGGK